MTLHTAKPAAEQTTLITQHEVTTGKASLSTSPDPAPQAGEQNHLIPSLCLGKAGAIEDADLGNAWFPIQWHRTASNFPSQ